MIVPHLLDSLVIEPDRGHRDFLAWMRAVLLAVAVLGAAGPTWKREAPPFVRIPPRSSSLSIFHQQFMPMTVCRAVPILGRRGEDVRGPQSIT
ncbi:hypothetical protein [Candidatus Phyllobacterium onerii]|uniref:hypothetical protein n=1 Tax=Candidatus Phyllobacterium onerii TaxID=3020828 RepID=UPI00232D5DED|nr:hypothetical protein [Phyllobacterium sp. IY22]